MAKRGTITAFYKSLRSMVWLECIRATGQYQWTLGDGFDLSDRILEHASIDCGSSEESYWSSIRSSHNNFNWNSSRPFVGFNRFNPRVLSRPVFHRTVMLRIRTVFRVGASGRRVVRGDFMHLTELGESV